MVKNISSFHGSVDDTAGSLAVTDVDNFHIVICESIQKLRIQLAFGSHAKTYETIIEWKFIFALAPFYQEGICFYFQKSSFGQLMYAMFFSSCIWYRFWLPDPDHGRSDPSFQR